MKDAAFDRTHLFYAQEYYQFKHLDIWGWNLKLIIQINDHQFVLDHFWQIEFVRHVCYGFLGSSLWARVSETPPE